jgi:hypothetical protein
MRIGILLTNGKHCFIHSSLSRKCNASLQPLRNHALFALQRDVTEEFHQLVGCAGVQPFGRGATFLLLGRKVASA